MKAEIKQIKKGPNKGMFQIALDGQLQEKKFAHKRAAERFIERVNRAARQKGAQEIIARREAK